MKIEFYCPLWGREDQPFDDFCIDVKEAGYDGVEMSFPQDKTKKNILKDTLNRIGLKIIAQHWETSEPDFIRHKEEYEQRLRNLAAIKPEFINSQTGKDWFTFAPNVTKEYLKRIQNLRLTLDISHWCNVSESFLDDQSAAVSLAIFRTDHIHARVGFPEGPQVPDPFAPEWSDALKRHVEWWNAVIDRSRKEDVEVMTITTEFGPAPYMPIEPYSGKPIADQWEINKKMRDYLAILFKM